jgi:tetratricopeptide (TPR) repeat protein
MRFLRICLTLTVLTPGVALGRLPAAAQAMPRPTPEVRALVNKALAALDDRDPKAAVRLSEEAMAMARARRDGYGEGDAARVLFQAYYADSQPRKALELLERYQKTVSTRQKAGDRKGAADALAVLGTLHALGRHWQQALETYEQELALRKALGDRLGTAWALVRIGWLDTSDSRLKSESFRKALVIFQSIGNRLGEAEVLDFAAEGSLGQPQKTLEYLRKSLRVYQAIGDRPTAFGESPSAIGVLLRRIGDEYNYRLAKPQRALEYYEKALPRFQASGDRKGEGSLLSAIGDLSKAQTQQALDYFLRALPITQATGNHYAEARTLIAIADVYQETGKSRQALEYYQKALVVCPLTSSADLEPQATFAIGDVYSGLGQPQEALPYYQRTVAIYEKFRPNLAGGQSRTKYLAGRIDTYYRCLQVLVQLGKTDEAFALAQKTKARSLLDLLTSGRVDLSAALNPSERREEQELLRKADSLNVAMVKEGVENQVGSKKRYEALKAQLKAVEGQLDALTETLYARHPGLAQNRIARTATAAEIGRMLPEDTALLEYVVVSGQDVRVFVVGNAGGKPTLSTHQVSGDYAALRQDAAAIHAACADPRQAYAAHCQKLYAALIRPVESEIAGKKRLIICPDGALWDVPFAALLAPGHAMRDTRYG